MAGPSAPVSASGQAVVIQNTVHAQPLAAIFQPIALKSKGAAFALTFFFGPLGMFYSTASGAVIMLVVSVLGALATLGLSVLITWPICIIWGMSAVDSWNRDQYRPVPMATFAASPMPPAASTIMTGAALPPSAPVTPTAPLPPPPAHSF